MLVIKKETHLEPSAALSEFLIIDLQFLFPIISRIKIIDIFIKIYYNDNLSLILISMLNHKMMLLDHL